MSALGKPEVNVMMKQTPPPGEGAGSADLQGLLSRGGASAKALEQWQVSLRNIKEVRKKGAEQSK